MNSSSAVRSHWQNHFISSLYTYAFRVNRSVVVNNSTKCFYKRVDYCAMCFNIIFSFYYSVIISLIVLINWTAKTDLICVSNSKYQRY